MLLAFVGLSCVPRFQATHGNELFASARNFYGVISVQERNVDDPPRRTVNFYSGRIAHGLQFVDPQKRREPTAYYGRPSGVGRLMTALAGRADLRVGVVGLGVGTLAAYAQPGQYFRFYELNDDVLRFAREHFSFLGDCLGEHATVLGDARLSLEQEQPQDFDVLVLDAFSGDAIPAHSADPRSIRDLFAAFAPHSIVAIHISNRYLDLSQVVAGLADISAWRTPSRVAGGTPTSTNNFRPTGFCWLR